MLISGNRLDLASIWVVIGREWLVERLDRVLSFFCAAETGDSDHRRLSNRGPGTTPCKTTGFSSLVSWACLGTSSSNEDLWKSASRRSAPTQTQWPHWPFSRGRPHQLKSPEWHTHAQPTSLSLTSKMLPSSSKAYSVPDSAEHRGKPLNVLIHVKTPPNRGHFHVRRRATDTTVGLHPYSKGAQY